MKTYLEIKFWRIVQWLIRKEWGANCTVPDYNEFPLHPRGVNDDGRCGSCQAKEVIDWIEENISLIGY